MLRASLIIKLVVREELFEAVKIETVLNVVHINLAEEVMVFQIAEPRDPPSLGII